MKYKFGFIGCGNMGSALALSVAKKVPAESLALCDLDEGKARELASRLGTVNRTVTETVLESEFIFVAVKPQGLTALFEEIRPLLESRECAPVFISMAAGTPIDKLLSIAGGEYPVIRIMPNTPVAVGSGVTLYSYNDMVTEGNVKDFLNAMTETGAVIKIDEEKFDSESIITGCGPAYVFSFINGMIEAAKALGVSAEEASIYAKYTVLGAAKLAVGSEESPSVLCQRVCSPGGSTIEGIKLMRERGFEETVVSAARASYERTLEMKKL